MSDMTGNPHYETGAYAAELVPSNREPNDDATVANTYATLALAYEQRTANLIALAQLAVSIDGPTVDVSKDIYTIESRLGIGQEES